MEIEKYNLLKRALTDYLQLMDREAFFEAHEVLEEAWHPFRRSRDALSDPLKGLINAAVAFEHIKRAKPDWGRKARSVMASFDRRCTGRRMLSAEEELFLQAREKVLRLKEIHKDVFDVLVS